MSHPGNDTAWREFVGIWAGCCATVLGQVSGRQFAASAEQLPVETATRGDSPAAAGHNFVVQLQKSLAGGCSLQVETGSSVVMSQLLMGEEPNPAAEFTSDSEDALAELIRQFCGSVSVALKSVQGEEVPVRLESMSYPGWQPAAAALCSLTDAGGLKVQIQLMAGGELLGSLSTSRMAPAQTPEPAPPESAPPQMSPDANAVAWGQFDLGMLRDIPLNARLSFGDHTMPLSDVLSCVPGSVVESDRPLEMPVELWVEGFLAARGEIVIVEGNYGVKILELCYSEARGSALLRGTILAA